MSREECQQLGPREASALLLSLNDFIVERVRVILYEEEEATDV